MKDGRLDAIDRQILSLLQDDARATMTEIAERLPVSGNTVRNRIQTLEEHGVITGYTLSIDYGAAELPFHYQFTCTTSIADRERLAAAALEIPGVVEVRELMTGERNLVIETAARDQDDVTRIAQALDDLGIEVVDETLIKHLVRQPVSYFEHEGESG
jgi:Lrp/AsnC family leucine-responsive transcriptional regulator